MKKGLFIFIISIIILGSCSFPELPIIESTSGTLNISVAGIPKESKRSIVPNIFNSITCISITGKFLDTSDTIILTEGENIISPGKWELTATAFNSDEEIILTGSNIVNVISGTQVSTEIVMETSKEGYGRLQVDLTFPENITSIEIELLDNEGSKHVIPIPNFSDQIFIDENLISGSYLMELKLYVDTEVAYSEIIAVHIYDNLICFFEKKIEIGDISKIVPKKWTWIVQCAHDTDAGGLKPINHLKQLDTNDEYNIIYIIDLPNSLIGSEELSDDSPQQDAIFIFEGDDFEDYTTDLYISLDDLEFANIETHRYIYEWIANTFPAEHYALFFEAHGNNNYINEPLVPISRSQVIDESEHFNPVEFSKIVQALTEEIHMPLDYFELSSCSVGSIEFLHELKDYTNYLRISQTMTYSPFFSFFEEFLQDANSVEELIFPYFERYIDIYDSPVFGGCLDVDYTDYMSTSLIDLREYNALYEALDNFSLFAINKLESDQLLKTEIQTLHQNELIFYPDKRSADLYDYFLKLKTLPSVSSDLIVLIDEVLTAFNDCVIMNTVPVDNDLHGLWIYNDSLSNNMHGYSPEIYSELFGFGSNHWNDYIECLLYTADQYEPDDTDSETLNIISSLSVYQSHTLTEANDIDWYRIETTKTTEFRYSIMVNLDYNYWNHDGTFQTEIYNSSSQLVATSDNNFLSVDDLSPDTYYLKVSCNYIPIVNFYSIDLEIIPTLIPPVPIAPDENAVLDNGNLESADRLEWYFDWTDIPNSEQYMIRVVNNIHDITFVDPAYTIDSEISWSLNREYSELDGWEWSVKARVGSIDEGMYSEWSEPRYFSLEPIGSDG